MEFSRHIEGYTCAGVRGAVSAGARGFRRCLLSLVVGAALVLGGGHRSACAVISCLEVQDAGDLKFILITPGLPDGQGDGASSPLLSVPAPSSSATPSPVDDSLGESLGWHRECQEMFQRVYNACKDDKGNVCLHTPNYAKLMVVARWKGVDEPASLKFPGVYLSAGNFKPKTRSGGGVGVSSKEGARDERVETARLRDLALYTSIYEFLIGGECAHCMDRVYHPSGYEGQRSAGQDGQRVLADEERDRLKSLEYKDTVVSYLGLEGESFV